MLDSKCFRQNLAETALALKRRSFVLDVEQMKQLEEQRKTLQIKTQELQNERNLRSKAIGQAKTKGEDVDTAMKEVAQLSEALKDLEQKTQNILLALNALQMTIPNILHASVPEGSHAADNVIIRSWGTPTIPSFPICDHVDLGEKLEQMDFALASKISGTRFVVLKKHLAKLHRALIQFFLDVQINEHGYEEVYVPYIVNHDSLRGTGQLPKFLNDQFNLEGHDYSLIPTAEVPVTNLVRDEIIDPLDLPLKYVAHTPCFRSEAGSYGKDTRGLIRQHQFEKVEMVRIVKPEESYQHLEALVQNAENLLQKLVLPYRVMLLCAGDTGFGSAKTYDIEVWIPSQKTYREISSCSNFEAFQARRMQARFRDPDTGKSEWVHTLNGSGLPAGRTLVAIMENYQDKEGNIHIPKVLQPYMNGLTVISSGS